MRLLLATLPQKIHTPQAIDAHEIIQGLLWIRPELILTLGILLVIFVDLITGLKEKQYCGHLSILVLLCALALVVGDIYSLRIGNGPGVLEGLGGTLKVDAFALFMKVIFVLSALLATIFSLYQSEVPFLGQGEYYSLILSVTLAASLLAQSQTLLMIFLSFEFISLPQYILSGSMKSERDSVEAALKYVIYGGVASGAMLFGFSLLYGFTGGHLDLVAIRHFFHTTEMSFGTADRVALTTILILILAGMGFKISAVPFHMWSPDVYQGAPTPIVAFFSIGPKAAGLAFMTRFFLNPATMTSTFPQIDWALIVAIISVASMTFGNLAALWQTNIKRLLAYSSIAHAGYILIGLVLVTHRGIESMLFYVVVYLIMNMGVFLSAISLIDATGEEDISRYGGLGWRLPIVSIPMVVFLVSLTGIPPTAGFTAKFMLFFAAEEAGWRWIYFIALLNTVVSLYYYINIIRYLYLREPDPEDAVEINPSRILFSYRFFLIVLLVATVGVFLYPAPVIYLADFAAHAIIAG